MGANCTNEVRLPSEKALSVLFGAVASAVVVLAVVLVVVTIVCQRRRRGTKAYYSVTIQPRDSDTRGQYWTDTHYHSTLRGSLYQCTESIRSSIMYRVYRSSLSCTESIRSNAPVLDLRQDQLGYVGYTHSHVKFEI